VEDASSHDVRSGCFLSRRQRQGMHGACKSLSMLSVGLSQHCKNGAFDNTIKEVYNFFLVFFKHAWVLIRKQIYQLLTKMFFCNGWCIDAKVK